MKKFTFLFLLLPFLGLSQVQIGQDIDGEALNDQFGTTVAISLDSNIIAIASSEADGVNDTSTGYVRIYENVGGVWTQIGENIYGEASGDRSGKSVSLSSDGTIVAVGANYNDGNGNRSGHVRIYEYSGGIWTQIGEDINGEASEDRFGTSVSLSSNGGIIAVGAINNNGLNGSFSGHVRVYENEGGIWTQIGEDIDGEASGDQFGQSVSLSSNGTIVAIGATSSDSSNFSNTGSASIYENEGGIWTQIGEDIDGEASGDQFGQSVSLSSDGAIVAIGAPQHGLSAGQVKIYKNVDSNWVQIGQSIDGENLNDNSSQSISLSSNGTIVAIGAHNNNPNNNGNKGHVRIFMNQEEYWTQVGEDIDGLGSGDLSGYSVSMSSSGDTVIIGAPEFMGFPTNDPEYGYARVFSITSELAILEVIEDIAGNSNGINVTANQLNSIVGVSGAVEGINYTTALDNGTFVDENNPTAAEIQLIIDQVNATLSISDKVSFEFKLYPNPAKNQVTIELDPSLQLEQVTIYNILGQEMLTSVETVIDTSQLSGGSYIVDITTNLGKSSKNLIIE